MTALTVDLFVDLNTIDDTGLPWSFLDQAADSSKIQVGAYIVVGTGRPRAIARVVDIRSDGVVHVLPLPGRPGHAAVVVK